METFVDGSIAIKHRSVGNVPDERLLNRLEVLREILSPAGSRKMEARIEFRHRVEEVTLVEDELNRRNVSFNPVTRRSQVWLGEPVGHVTIVDLGNGRSHSSSL